MLVINLVYKLGKVSPFGGLIVVKIIGLWIIVSAITIGLVSIGRKIPGIRYLL